MLCLVVVLYQSKLDLLTAAVPRFGRRRWERLEGYRPPQYFAFRKNHFKHGRAFYIEIVIFFKTLLQFKSFLILIG